MLGAAQSVPRHQVWAGYATGYIIIIVYMLLLRSVTVELNPGTVNKSMSFYHAGSVITLPIPL